MTAHLVYMKGLGHSMDPILIDLGEGEKHTVGRHPDADTTIITHDKGISRFHVELSFDDVTNRYWLRDLQSTNKTHLNGQVLLSERIELNDGDIIDLAPPNGVSFSFVTGESPSLPAALPNHITAYESELGVSVDPHSRMMKIDGHPGIPEQGVQLTRREAEIMEFLIVNARRYSTTTELINLGWPKDAEDETYLERDPQSPEADPILIPGAELKNRLYSLIRNIRKKIELNNETPEILINLKNTGYKIIWGRLN